MTPASLCTALALSDSHTTEPLRVCTWYSNSRTMPSRCISRANFSRALGIDIDAVCNVADGADQILRRRITHHPRQRRIGVQQRTARRRDVNSVDRGLEQLAVAFLGEPLFGERANRRLARRIGIDQRLPEHLGGAGDVADLVVDVGRRDRGVLLAAGHRADRVCDARQAGARCGGPPVARQTARSARPRSRARCSATWLPSACGRNRGRGHGRAAR